MVGGVCRHIERTGSFSHGKEDIRVPFKTENFWGGGDTETMGGAYETKGGI